MSGVRERLLEGACVRIQQIGRGPGKGGQLEERSIGGGGARQRTRIVSRQHPLPIVENAYLKFYTRRPTASEVELWLDFFRTGNPQENWLMFFLTLASSNEFLYT